MSTVLLMTTLLVSFTLSKAYALQYGPNPPKISLTYTIIPVNTTSAERCEYIGYTEIEVQIDPSSTPGGGTSSMTIAPRRLDITMTINALRNRQLYEVAVVKLKEGVYRYPVEFFASDCTERLFLEFST